MSPTTTCLLRQELADADLITLLIGSNDTVLQLMGAMGRATNGKATKLLIPLLTGTMRELNLQTLQTLKKGLENLDLTPEELKAALKLLDSGMEEICDQTRDQTVANVEQILQELRALNPDAQIILVGYYNPLPFLPTYGRHFRLLNRSVKAWPSSTAQTMCPSPIPPLPTTVTPRCAVTSTSLARS